MEHKLQAWLSEHADRLKWHEEEGCYRIAVERISVLQRLPSTQFRLIFQIHSLC